jgi:hypothetical protein
VRNVYESITYEELKSLPRDQKVEALKESGLFTLRRRKSLKSLASIQPIYTI